MLGCKLASTPLDPNHKLGIEVDGPLVEKRRYQRLVGKLRYLSHTRLNPNIGFVVSFISQFMNNPSEAHMNAVYQVLRYLKATLGKGLIFIKTTNRDIPLYSDANWA